MMTSNVKKVKNFLWSNKIYFLSFMIPLIIMVIIFYESKIYPFDNYNFLMYDSFEQYTPFLKGFYRKLIEGSGLEYSWNTGLGTGYAAMYAYYLASPINWLIILIPQKHILDMVDILIVLKISLCGLTFSYYLSKRFNTKKISVTAISLCYALSAYVVQYCGNIIWLDCLLLFPLIILGIENLYSKGRHRLYFFSLTLAIISNYYISIIICIFMVLYFVMLFFTDEKRKTLKEKLPAVKSFIIYSLLAGGISAAIVLPAIAALGETQSGHLSFPKTLKMYISLSDLAMRPLILVPKELTDYFPNLYCSVIVLLLIPAYIFNSKISLRRKVGNLVLTVFMLLSFEINLLDYVWHGFHFTNGAFARNSFIYVFLVLVMVYEALIHIKELPDKYFVGSIGIALIDIFALWKLKINNTGTEVYYAEKIIYLTLDFVVVYMLFLLCYRGMKGRQGIISVLLLLTVSYELYMNAGVSIYSTNTRSSMLYDNAAIETLIEEAKKEENGSFFRMEKESRRSPNDGEWDGYYGTSSFSSTSNEGVGKFYSGMGLEQSMNYYTYYGHTPLLSSLFSIKYVLTGDELAPEDNYELFDAYSDKNAVLYMYQNKYALSLGFMVDSGLEDKISLNEKNSFEAINSLYQGVTGNSDEMFSSIQVKNKGKKRLFTVDSDARVYFKCSESPYDILVNIQNADGKTETRVFSYIAHSYISDLGNLEKGTKVEMQILDEGYDDYEIYACSYNPETMKKAYQVLNQSQMEIENFRDTHIKGNVEAEEDGLLFTSIPYDKGWSVYVDGKKVKVHRFKDAFISVYLEKGEHTIELKYATPGRISGLAISIACIIIYIILQVVGRKNKSEKMPAD